MPGTWILFSSHTRDLDTLFLSYQGLDTLVLSYQGLDTPFLSHQGLRYSFPFLPGTRYSFPFIPGIRYSFPFIPGIRYSFPFIPGIRYSFPFIPEIRYSFPFIPGIRYSFPFIPGIRYSFPFISYQGLDTLFLSLHTRDLDTLFLSYQGIRYSFSVIVTARVWCRGGIDRKKKNSTINLTSVNSACFWCLPQTSPLTPDVTTNKYLDKCSGERQKYIWNNHNNYIIPRLTLLIKIFIHTYNHSFTVLSAKSINNVSLPWKLSDFLDTSFSWTLSFPLGPYFSSFSLGTF